MLKQQQVQTVLKIKKCDNPIFKILNKKQLLIASDHQKLKQNLSNEQSLNIVEVDSIYQENPNIPNQQFSQYKLNKYVNNMVSGFNVAMIMYNSVHAKTSQTLQETLKMLFNELFVELNKRRQRSLLLQKEKATTTKVQIEENVNEGDNNDGKINKENKNFDYKVTFSCIQLYREKIFNATKCCSYNSDQQLKLRLEQQTDNFKIEKITQLYAQNQQALYQHLINVRKLSQSSKHQDIQKFSHFVYEIKVQDCDQYGNQCRRSALIAELADSEKSEKGESKFNEKINKQILQLNKSLFHLRKVIKMLAEKSQEKKKHIPFRDSRLTSILKKGLGGNCYTLLIACIDPSSNFYEESMQTLNDLTNVKKIKNTMRVNIDHRALEVLQLRSKKIQLQNELREHKARLKILQKRDFDKSELQRANAQNTSRLVQCVSNVRDLLQSNKQLRHQLQQQKLQKQKLLALLEISQDQVKKLKSQRFRLKSTSKKKQDDLQNSNDEHRKSVHTVTNKFNKLQRIKINTLSSDRINKKQNKVTTHLESSKTEQYTMPRMQRLHKNTTVDVSPSNKTIKSVSKSFTAKNKQSKFSIAIQKRKQSIKKSEERYEALDYKEKPLKG